MSFFDMPAGFSDADMEMAQLTEMGNRAAALKKQGLCAHGWLREQAGGTVKCLDCSRVFESYAHWHQERTELLI